MKKYVSYIRCSTNSQFESSLGLYYQKKMIENYIFSIDGELVKSFIEISSGSDKKHIRPIFKESIDFCKTNDFILIASHVDRLCRSKISFDLIKESNIKFITLDNLTNEIDVLNEKINFGIEELGIISERTKNALKIKSEILKKEGKSLGNPNLDKVRHLAHTARIESILTDKERNDLSEKIFELYQQNRTYKKCSDKLNDLNIKQPNGKPFTQQQVRRYVQRYQKLQNLLKSKCLTHECTL